MFARKLSRPYFSSQFANWITLWLGEQAKSDQFWTTERRNGFDFAQRPLPKHSLSINWRSSHCRDFKGLSHNRAFDSYPDIINTKYKNLLSRFWCGWFWGRRRRWPRDKERSYLLLRFTGNKTQSHFKSFRLQSELLILKWWKRYGT